MKIIHHLENIQIIHLIFIACACSIWLWFMSNHCTCSSNQRTDGKIIHTILFVSSIAEGYQITGDNILIDGVRAEINKHGTNTRRQRLSGYECKYEVYCVLVAPGPHTLQVKNNKIAGGGPEPITKNIDQNGGETFLEMESGDFQFNPFN